MIPYSLMIAGRGVATTAFLEAKVTTGREDIDSQPDATVLSLTLRNWQDSGQIGDSVTLSDSIGQLFAGKITDLDTRLELWRTDPQGNEIRYWRTRVMATGPLADLGRTIIGDEPWPVETDSQRVSRVMQLANAPANVNPGILGPNILARDVDRKTALAVAQETASDAMGVLWEQPTATQYPIQYLPARMRVWGSVALTWAESPADLNWSELPVGMTWNDWSSQEIGLPADPGELILDGDEVLLDIGFSQRIGDLIKTVRVAYGSAEPRDEVKMGSGIPEISRSGQLADNQGALMVADLLYRARREPGWRISDIRIDLDDGRIPHSRVVEIRGHLGMGTRLTIKNIGFASPIGPNWEGYLEGWTHDLRAHHSLTLITSERNLTEPADRWQDINPATQWNTLSPTMTWEQTGDIGEV